MAITPAQPTRCSLDRLIDVITEMPAGKGAKGGKSCLPSDVSDSSTISIVSTGVAAAGLRRTARRKVSERAGKSWNGRLPAARFFDAGQTVTNNSASNNLFAQSFQRLGYARAIILRLAPGVIALSHVRNRTVTCGS